MFWNKLHNQPPLSQYLSMFLGFSYKLWSHQHHYKENWAEHAQPRKFRDINWGEFAAAFTNGGYDDADDDDNDDDDGSGLPTVGVVAADDSRELPVSDHHMGNTPAMSRQNDDDHHHYHDDHDGHDVN